MIGLLVDGLAVWRLTRLAVEDRIGDRPRFWLQARSPFLDELLDCPHCTSVWVAAGVTAARHATPRLWAPVAYGLALAGGVSLVADLRTRAGLG